MQTKKSETKSSLIIFLASFAVFFVTTLFANKYLSAFDVSSVRISAVLNPILGITFGWPAILACAAANFFCDLISGWGLVTAILGLPGQIIYGFIPYFLWRRFIGCKSHITRLDGPKKVLVLLLIILANSVLIGLYVGLVQWITAGTDFLRSAFFVALNDYTACVFFGLPILSLFDYIYSKKIHNGKRKLSFNEIIILVTGLVQLAAFAVIAVFHNIIRAGQPTTEIWQEIFIIAVIVSSVITLISIAAMLYASYLRKKNAGLRIIEKPHGMIFVDEKKHLEFVSFPGHALKYRIKSGECGSDSNITREVAASYEEAWYTGLSCQKGCPMDCLFCDAPGYGYYGSPSVEELKYQLNTILDNAGSTHTQYFEVDLMRVGEPVLNESVLDFIEFDLLNTIRSKVDADRIVPCISTMLPKNKTMVTEFLQRFCRIKNDVLDGDANLQLSIFSTDENKRKELFKNMSLTLEEIAEISKSLPAPKGSKYRLNFPVTGKSVIDADVIDRLFDKEKFAIKLTPVHCTFNAHDNGLFTNEGYDSADVFLPIEKTFTDKGWEVLVFMDKKTEDSDGLTCGHLLLSNIDDKFSNAPSEKKRVGMVCAIEINAIFEMYKNVKQLENYSGFKLFLVEKDNYSIYIAQSGMGECSAAAATQYLISKCGVKMIINFGVVGGLTDEMKQLKVCLVEKVVHYKYDCSEFMPLIPGQVDGYDTTFIKTSENLVKQALMLDEDLNLVTCCSGDKFIGTAQEKTYLHNTFGGDICDMEAAGIVLTCDANSVPCIMFKAVSDGLSDGADGFFAELDNASKKCLEITGRILDRIATIES